MSVRGGLGAGAHAEFAKKVSHMGFDGSLGDEQLLPDDAIGRTGREETEHRLLTLGQPVRGCVEPGCVMDAGER